MQRIWRITPCVAISPLQEQIAGVFFLREESSLRQERSGRFRCMRVIRVPTLNLDASNVVVVADLEKRQQTMAQTNSFDITTGVDLQEVDNAINQAQKEIAQRYDFKGSKASIDFQRAASKLVLVADDDYKMRALMDILQGKLIKRGVPVKNLDIGEVKPAGNDTVRREIALKMSLDGDTSKKVVAAIKEAKMKKVTAAIQGEQVRVSSASKDELQTVMNLLRGQDFGVELKFGNYR